MLCPHLFTCISTTYTNPTPLVCPYTSTQPPLSVPIYQPDPPCLSLYINLTPLVCPYISTDPPCLSLYINRTGGPTPQKNSSPSSCQKKPLSGPKIATPPPPPTALARKNKDTRTNTRAEIQRICGGVF